MPLPPTGWGRGAQIYGLIPSRGPEPTTPVPPPPQLTPEEWRALRRIHHLKIVNVLLLFPFAFFALWYASLAANPQYNNYWGYKILTSVVALLILALVIRNEVVKRRLGQKYF